MVVVVEEVIPTANFLNSRGMVVQALRTTVTTSSKLLEVIANCLVRVLRVFFFCCISSQGMLPPPPMGNSGPFLGPGPSNQMYYQQMNPQMMGGQGRGRGRGKNPQKSN